MDNIATDYLKTFRCLADSDYFKISSLERKLLCFFRTITQKQLRIAIVKIKKEKRSV